MNTTHKEKRKEEKRDTDRTDIENYTNHLETHLYSREAEQQLEHIAELLKKETYTGEKALVKKIKENCLIQNVTLKTDAAQKTVEAVKKTYQTLLENKVLYTHSLPFKREANILEELSLTADLLALTVQNLKKEMKLKEDNKDLNHETLQLLRNTYLYWAVHAKLYERKTELKHLQKTVETLCKEHERPVNVRRHYEALSNWYSRPGEDIENLNTEAGREPVLVVYRAGEYAAQMQTDLSIQNVKLDTGTERVKFAILPRNTAQRLHVNVAQNIPYRTLNLEKETLNTASLLFLRNKYDFTKCIEIAERI